MEVKIMATGEIRTLRHTAVAEAAKVPATLTGRPGLRRREQRANLEAALEAALASADALQSALEVLEDRKQAAKAAKKG